MANTEIRYGGGELNLNFTTSLLFNQTIVSITDPQTETLIDSGTQSAISGVYVENTYFDLQGGNNISSIAVIPGGGAFFFQIVQPTPEPRRIYLLKRWY
jgi:hypothetical protein